MTALQPCRKGSADRMMPGLRSRIYLIISLAAIPLHGEIMIENRPLTSSEIYVSPEFSETGTLAGRELSDYLQKITGSNYSVVQSRPSGDKIQPAFRLQKYSSMQEPELTLKHQNRIGFIIQVDQQSITISAASGESILHGTYFFLERYAGCRFLAESVEWVPQSRPLYLSQVKDIQIPDFRTRSILSRSASNPTFSAKLRLNGNDSIMVEGKYRAIPRDFLNPIRSPFFILNKGFDIGHPEVLALIRGRRNRSQLCYSSLELLNQIKKLLPSRLNRVPQWIDAQSNHPTNKHNSWDRVDLSMADRFESCQCTLCREKAERHSSSAASLIDLAGKLAESFPHARFSSSAYWHTSRPPVGLPIPENLEIRYSLANGSVNKPLATSILLRDKVVISELNGWRQMTENITAEYPVEPENHRLLHFPNFLTIEPNLKKLYNMKIRKVQFQGDPDLRLPFSDMRNYMAARLMWDRHQSSEKLIKEFCNLYYGPAGPAIYRFIQFSCNNAFYLDLSVNTGSSPVDHQAGYLSATLHRSYYKLFKKAEAAVKDNPVLLKRVQREKLSILYSSIVLRHGSPHEIENHKEEFSKISTDFGDLIINNETIRLAEFLKKY